MRQAGSPADNGFLPQERWLPLAFSAIVTAATLYAAYQRTPVLAHDIAEMFSFVVAFGIFMLTWNARKLIDNHYFLFLGIAYLYIGAIDYMHALSLEGVFSTEHHTTSIELWYAARYLQGFALLLAPLFVSRKIRSGVTLAAFAAVALALLGAVYSGTVPDYYVPGKGLTAAKTVSGYLVSGIFAFSLVHLWRVREQFDRDVFRMLVLSVLFLIAAELSAVFYTDAFVYNSVAGHYLKIVSFYLVYKAVFVTGLTRPYDLMFRNLNQSAEEVRFARDLLASQVAVRTAELQAANLRLEEELSERRRVAGMRELVLDLLQLTQPADSIRALLSSLTGFLQARFGFEAVGFRFRKDDDYPYFETRGFPREFVLEEASLCPPNRIDPGDDPAGAGTDYECTCGAVIAGRFDPTLPFFTPRGTFWTNDAPDLLSASGAYRSIATRGRCVREGYESIALVPLRLGEKIFGLLQLNDRRKGMFTPDLLTRIERIAEIITGRLDQLLAKEALRESEDRFRSLAENTSVAILIYQRGRIVYGTPRLEQIFGKLPEKIPFRELAPVHPEDTWKFERLCDEIDGPAPGYQDVDIRFLLPDGEEGRTRVRWVKCQAKPVNFRGRASTLVDLVDITRVKELEESAAAREKLASLGQMASGIAHEIRNPLSGININVSTLDLLCQRTEGLDPEEKGKIRFVLAQVKAASEKISKVIQRVMEFSRGAPPKLVRVDVNRVLRNTLALPVVSTRGSGIELQERPSPGPLYCRADPTLLEQVLLNLVMNAFQAMENSGRPARLTVSAAREGDRAVLRVCDTGPGVPEHLRVKIFEPFYTTRKDGYGIGLSFSHRIVSEHGGRLSIGAAKGGGAEFRVELPLMEEGSRT